MNFIFIFILIQTILNQDKNIEYQNLLKKVSDYVSKVFRSKNLKKCVPMIMQKKWKMDKSMIIVQKTNS